MNCEPNRFADYPKIYTPSWIYFVCLCSGLCVWLTSACGLVQCPGYSGTSKVQRGTDGRSERPVRAGGNLQVQRLVQRQHGFNPEKIKPYYYMLLTSQWHQHWQQWFCRKYPLSHTHTCRHTPTHVQLHFSNCKSFTFLSARQVTHTHTHTSSSSHQQPHCSQNMQNALQRYIDLSSLLSFILFPPSQFLSVMQRKIWWRVGLWLHIRRLRVFVQGGPKVQDH